jgi:NADH dehydrogenase
VYFLIGARNRLSVAFDWTWEYLTLQRGARLINDPKATASFRPRPPTVESQSVSPATEQGGPPQNSRDFVE